MSKKMQDTGKKIQSLGCLMSAVITIPIIGLVIGGPIGLMLGVLLGGLIVTGLIKSNKEE